MDSNSKTLFFQIAAGLIPVLVFGSLLSDRLKPGPWVATKAWGPFGALAIVVLLTFVPPLAEVTAISAALGNEPDRFGLWLVTGTITCGTGALALSLAWPWLKTLDQLSGSVRRRALFRVSTAVGVGIGALFSAGVLQQAIRLHASDVALDRLQPLTRQYFEDSERVNRALAALGKPGAVRPQERATYLAAQAQEQLTLKLILEEFKAATPGD